MSGVSSNPCSEIYPGTAAFSEPESQNLRDVLASIPNLEVYLTFHSYGQYVLYPWGYDRINAPNYQQLVCIVHCVPYKHNIELHIVKVSHWLVFSRFFRMFVFAFLLTRSQFHFNFIIRYN